MPTTDDMAPTLLKALQNERTEPGGGWYSVFKMAASLGLSPIQVHKLDGALRRLKADGLIEERYNPDLMRHEWRATTGHAPEHRAPEPAPEPAPEGPLTIFPATFGGEVHAAWLKDEYPSPAWLARCGLAVKPAHAPTTIGPVPVTCPGCVEQIERAARIRAVTGRQTK